MLVREQYIEISILHKQGLSNRKIAKVMGISRNTVKKYLASLNPSIYKTRPLQSTKLSPYHDYLKQRVHAAFPEWLPATVLFSEIQTKGYMGQISQLRAYLRSLKPLPKPDPIVRFETEPDEQMQVDWAEFKFGKVKLHAFVATLGYSRYCYVEFVDNQFFSHLDKLRTHPYYRSNLKKPSKIRQKFIYFLEDPSQFAHPIFYLIFT